MGFDMIIAYDFFVKYNVFVDMNLFLYRIKNLVSLRLFIII